MDLERVRCPPSVTGNFPWRHFSSITSQLVRRFFPAPPAVVISLHSNVSQVLCDSTILLGATETEGLQVKLSKLRSTAGVLGSIPGL